MHHPCLFLVRSRFFVRSRTVRLAAASGVLLAISALTPPPRSAAQDPQNPPASSSGADSGGYLPGDPSNPNPPVGVDTSGHADAVATRNGRTTRQRLPAAPTNPLVLTDPVRSPDVPSGDRPNEYPSNYPADAQGNYPGSAQDNPNAYSYNSAYPYNSAYSNNFQAPAPTAPGNRLIPPVVTRPPGNYTVQTDPASLGLRRYSEPLPLFGYDFFQPARQIIIARRRALLPVVPRVNRAGNAASGTRQYGRVNAAAGGYPNGYPNNNYANNYANGDANGTGPRPNTGAFNSNSNNNTNNNVNNNGSSNYNNSNYNNSNYNNSDYNTGLNSTDGNDAALLGAGTTLGMAGQAQPGYNQPGYNQPGGNGPYQNQPGSQGQTNPPYPNSSANPDEGYSNPSTGVYPDNSENGASLQNSSTFDSSDLNNSDLNNNALNGDVTSSTILRRRTTNSNRSFNSQDPSALDPNYSADNYSADNGVDTLGSAIQFPGDDALVQNGTANAVTGQIADPVSTLYRNVLASLPPNYQLQPGDSLTVRYSALTLAPREFTTTVDLQGGIDVAGVGRISVAGRTASQAEDTLRQRLERLYRNVDVSINLRQLRTIQVTVSGAAFAPGTYTVPATATAFNVLNAAGGPTADGSLRDIRVLRGGHLAGVLDIYPLIGASSASPGAKNGDIALQAGDNIYIPARLSRIAIRGEVRQQAIYELTPSETLRDALRYAGGVKPSGVDQNVHIDTINNGTDRIIRDVNLRDKAKVASVHVYDGDTIEVSSIRAILTNRVTVAGAVDQPGDYALTPGMTVADLIARARGPLYNAYLDRADLTRLNADNTTTLQSLSIAKALDGDPAQNIPLKRFDILRLYSRQEVAYLGRRLVTVRGAVQRPGLYTQSDNMRVSDLLLDSGGPLPDAYLNRAVLLHQRGDGTYAYDYVSLRDVLSGDSRMDLPIHDNDVLAIYRIGEAHFTPDHTVKVLGNVVAPGLYARGDNMRLSDLLKLAGAFKPGGGTRVTIAHARRPVTDPILQVASQTVAYTADQTVASGTDLMLQDGDVVAVQGDGTLQDHPAVVTVTGMVNRPGPIIIRQGMHLSDAIKQAGGLRPEAFPQGAEFTRTSDSLVTAGQLDLAAVINRMSDMLNLSQYQRERAKANLALIEAAGSAAGGSSSGLAIPGIGGAANNAANPNLAPLIATLPQNNPVSPGRLLTLSQLRPNGAVAVQLAQALKRPGSLEDVLLKDGDTLVVPETPTTVQVVGAVFNTRGVLYRPGQSIDYYIQRAGDFTPDAARDRIEVIHAGGGLIPAGKAGALQPGDLILVPTKVLAEKIGRSGNGFSDFFQGLVGSAITLKVLSSVFGL